jgi:2-polyprenyl-6-methoxyphenol hydroxylase-like FAD-dependent oxidoreductase
MPFAFANQQDFAICRKRRKDSSPAKAGHFVVTMTKSMNEAGSAGNPSTAVAIIGAGIAGPTLGIALRRAGFEPVVYEATDRPRDNAGAFLNVAPNGINALRALGLEHVLDGIGFQNDRLIFHNEAGRVLADVPVGGITVMRGGLSRALREAAERAGVRFEFGKALASIDERDGRVLAHFADGTTARSRVLVGADGIHSRTRQSYFGDAPQPTYTGIINLGGIVTTDLAPTSTAMHMVFGRRSFFGYAVRPGGQTYWFSNFARRNEPPRGQLSNVDAAQFTPELHALHRDDPPEVRRILKALHGEIGIYPVHDILSLPTWHRGAVCLIGDAAHAIGPHVGQGVSLALEDSLILARCLRDMPDAAAAFAAFERLRRARVDPIAKQSRRTGQQKAPAGWVGRKVRDLVLPIFLRSAARGASEIYRYPLDWNERVSVHSS